MGQSKQKSKCPGCGEIVADSMRQIHLYFCLTPTCSREALEIFAGPVIPCGRCQRPVPEKWMEEHERWCGDPRLSRRQRAIAAGPRPIGPPVPRSARPAARAMATHETSEASRIPDEELGTCNLCLQQFPNTVLLSHRQKCAEIAGTQLKTGKDSPSPTTTPTATLSGRARPSLARLAGYAQNPVRKKMKFVDIAMNPSQGILWLTTALTNARSDLGSNYYS